MWESIKNKFRRKKHVEEEKIEESVVSNEEEQSTDSGKILDEEYLQPESGTDELGYHEKTTENTIEVEKSDVAPTENDEIDDTGYEDSETLDVKSENGIDEEKSEDEEKLEETDNQIQNNLSSEETENEIELKQIDDEPIDRQIEDRTEISENKEEEIKPEKPKKRGFFGKLIDGLTKTRDSFVSGLENVFSGFSEIDDDFYEELEEVLIMADIGVATTEKIIENLQAKVKENKIKEVAVCRQLLIDSIKEQMRVHDDAYDFENKKSVVMLIGVNGVGKTTSVGKLASQFKADGKKVILAAADTFRAAAIEQLTEWSNRAGVELIAGQEGGDPAAVVFDAVNAAKARNADILICDTAGRLHNKKNLMEELKKINRIVEREYPDAYRETFVVLDGTTGQNALAQAKQFSQVADITGIILTKLDGTAKGGIAIAIQSEMNIPVKYIGIGEHIEDLQKFDADAFVDALFETKAE
ncbi:signal recognition particle-docking protein FtsY [Eubacterium sp. MSJ-13]|nr:signal recognition particle-docking protein FtsY [Eubacterium sp. MSJ-13]